jgi:hypothetical protein
MHAGNGRKALTKIENRPILRSDVEKGASRGDGDEPFPVSRGAIHHPRPALLSAEARWAAGCGVRRGPLRGSGAIVKNDTRVVADACRSMHFSSDRRVPAPARPGRDAFNTRRRKGGQPWTILYTHKEASSGTGRRRS